MSDERPAEWCQARSREKGAVPLHCLALRTTATRELGAAARVSVQTALAARSLVDACGGEHGEIECISAAGSRDRGQHAVAPASRSLSAALSTSGSTVEQRSLKVRLPAISRATGGCPDYGSQRANAGARRDQLPRLGSQADGFDRRDLSRFEGVVNRLGHDLALLDHLRIDSVSHLHGGVLIGPLEQADLSLGGNVGVLERLVLRQLLGEHLGELPHPSQPPQREQCPDPSGRGTARGTPAFPYRWARLCTRKRVPTTISDVLHSRVRLPAHHERVMSARPPGPT